MSKFLVFEGIDRAGKSSTLSYVKQFLEQRDIATVSTVTKCVAGNRIPSMLGHYPDEIVYMFFWQAIRMAELTVIRPALEADKVVLCDRYVLSNLAYEWWDNLDPDFKKHMDEVYLDRCLVPDATFLFTIPYDAFVERDDGATELTRARFDAIQQSYIWWGKQLLSEGVCIVPVEGAQTEERVHHFVLGRVLSVLGLEAEVKV